jgi:hypothetical protein
VHGLAVRFDDDPEPTAFPGNEYPLPDASIWLALLPIRCRQSTHDISRVDVAPISSAEDFQRVVARPPEGRRRQRPGGSAISVQPCGSEPAPGLNRGAGGRSWVTAAFIQFRPKPSPDRRFLAFNNEPLGGAELQRPGRDLRRQLGSIPENATGTLHTADATIERMCGLRLRHPLRRFRLRFAQPIPCCPADAEGEPGRIGTCLLSHLSAIWRKDETLSTEDLRHHGGTINLDLDPEEERALAAELRRIIADDRYPPSRRICTLRGILDKLEPPPPRVPLPPLKLSPG